METQRYGQTYKNLCNITNIPKDELSMTDSEARSLRRFENDEVDPHLSSVFKFTHRMGIRMSEFCTEVEANVVLECPLTLEELVDCEWYFDSYRRKIEESLELAPSELLRAVCRKLISTGRRTDWVSMLRTGVFALCELMRRQELEYVHLVCRRLSPLVDARAEGLPIDVFLKFEMINALTSQHDNGEINRLINVSKLLGIKKLRSELYEMSQMVNSKEKYKC